MDVDGPPDAGTVRERERAWELARGRLAGRAAHEQAEGAAAERGETKPEQEEQGRARLGDEGGPAATPVCEQARGMLDVDELDGAVRLRLDRVVALAGRRHGGGLHAELLEELRALVRQAEDVRPPAAATRKGVAERPARRLHGT